jgi:hypothetical protein
MATNGEVKGHTIQVRVPMRLWQKFRAACRRNDSTPSEVLRDMMRTMVKEEPDVRRALDRMEQEVRASLGTSGPAVRAERKLEDM